MPIRRTQFVRRAALASCLALAASSASAFAKDLAPSPDSAAKLQAFFAAYFGKQAPVTLSPADPGFWAAFDLAAVTAPLKTSGFAYDSATLKYHLVEQDDGLWRVEQTDIPPIVGHMKDETSTLTITGVKNTLIVDPSIAWWRSLNGSADRVTMQAKTPGVDETFDLGALQVTGEGKATPDGLASATMHQSFAGAKATIDVSPKPDSDAKPTHVDINADRIGADVTLDGVKSRALLDVWAFLVAHPSRPELAANEAAFKTLLAAALASPLKVDESVSVGKTAVQTPQGAVTIDSAKFGFAAAAGATGSFEERFAADGLALPATLIPGPFRDFAPTSFAVAFRAAGFDVASTVAEMLADMHLAGEGPAIAPDDQAKIHAKLIGPDGIVIDIEPSHILAPLLDVSFEGRIVYKGAKPTGKLTVHMHNFDKTQAALKTLGPEVEKKIAPMLAMAKGLAKADSDGSLTWVGEIGADGVMKVNGLPLGKSPI
jgi:hypothetical protein